MFYCCKLLCLALDLRGYGARARNRPCRQESRGHGKGDTGPISPALEHLKIDVAIGVTKVDGESLVGSEYGCEAIAAIWRSRCSVCSDSMANYLPPPFLAAPVERTPAPEKEESDAARRITILDDCFTAHSFCFPACTSPRHLHEPAVTRLPEPLPCGQRNTSARLRRWPDRSSAP